MRAKISKKEGKGKNVFSFQKPIILCAPGRIRIKGDKKNFFVYIRSIRKKEAERPFWKRSLMV